MLSTAELLPSLPWHERRAGAPWLPGGGKELKTRLFGFLEFVSGGARADWLAGESTQASVQRQLGPLGLHVRTESGVALTTLGKELLEDKSDLAVLLVLHGRLSYVGEMLNLLESQDSRVEDMLADAVDRYHTGWSSKDQIRRRIAWLQALGFAEEIANRYYQITESGREALSLLEVALPDEVTFRSEIADDSEIEPPPAAIAELLDEVRASPERRRLAFGYFTGTPADAITSVVERARGGTSRDRITAELAEEFGLSNSSAVMLLGTARILGLWDFTGKETIASTAIGDAWESDPSPVNLIRLLHAAYVGVGEILLILNENPIPAGQVHRELFGSEKGGRNQGVTSTLLQRLVDAGAAAELGYRRYVITARGSSLLLTLPMIEMNAENLAVSPDAAVKSPIQTASDFAEELLAASVDSTHPTRFEKAVAEAFRLLGARSSHLGGPGRTDVLVEAISNLVPLGRAVVDAKSAASGQLLEKSVDLETLHEHAARADATRIAVVAPGYESAGRLPRRAHDRNVVLLTAAELGDLVVQHHEYPLTAEDVFEVLSLGGLDRVMQRRAQAVANLTLVKLILRELVAEASQSNPEPVTARDIYRVLRKETEVDEAEVANALAYLKSPHIEAVQEVEKGMYALPSPLATVALRVRALAFAIESAAEAPVAS